MYFNDILFAKLAERSVPPILNQFLLSWYKSHRMKGHWNASFSLAFPVSNGVQQGNVPALILFTIYMNDLLKGLTSLGIGCLWDGYFAGAVLAPSWSAFCLMLCSCEDFPKLNSSVLEPYLFLLFRHHLLLGCCSSFRDVTVHLGHHIHYGLSDADDILCKTWDVNRKASLMLYTFQLPMLLSTFICYSHYMGASSGIFHLFCSLHWGVL